jgi:hypothetical protein
MKNSYKILGLSTVIIAGMMVIRGLQKGLAHAQAPIDSFG